MLLSTKAGGLGLNLQVAKFIVVLDQDFNPQNTLQAVARAHRVGQDAEVTVYHICTKGTVEEQMLTRLSKKLYLSNRVSGLQDEGLRKSEDDILSGSALKNMLFWGSQVLTEDFDPVKMLEWDVEKVIDECKSNATAEISRDEKLWLAEVEHVKCAIFEGVKLQRQKEKTPEIDLNLPREQRRRGKETTVMIDGFAVSKDSAQCAWGEAVPTLTGKHADHSNLKREKGPSFEHQKVLARIVFFCGAANSS